MQLVYIFLIPFTNKIWGGERTGLFDLYIHMSVQSHKEVRRQDRDCSAARITRGAQGALLS